MTGTAAIQQLHSPNGSPDVEKNQRRRRSSAKRQSVFDKQAVSTRQLQILHNSDSSSSTPSPGEYNRSIVRHIVESALCVVILLYLVLAVLESSVEDGSNDDIETAVNIAEVIFCGCLLLELIVKIFTQGRQYYSDLFNIWDALVILVTFVLLLALEFRPRILFRILRVVIFLNRYHRIFRLYSSITYRPQDSALSPVEQSLALLTNLRNKYSLDREDEASVNHLSQLIITNKLYATSQENQLHGADDETAQFIMKNLSYGIEVSPKNAHDSVPGHGHGHMSLGKGKSSRASFIRRGTTSDIPNLSGSGGGGLHFSRGDDSLGRASAGGALETFSFLLDKHSKIAAISRLTGNIPMSHIDKAVAELDTWEFDCFQLDAVSNKHALLVLGHLLFLRHDLYAKLGIEEAVGGAFFDQLERGYLKSNTYHNSIHAADVLQTAHYFCIADTLTPYFSDLDTFAVLISAAMHDFEHPGTNNAYQIATNSKFAMVYNDRSVLESHHVAATFMMMASNPGYNLMLGFTPENYKEVRETVICMVLATDMRFHFEEISHFRAQVLAEDSPDVNPEKLEDRRMLLKMLLHCADVSNPAKPLALYQEWTTRVMEEFFKQGDLELEKGLPISAFMDRRKPTTAKCQIGFITFIVAPLYDAWSDFVREIKPLMEERLNENLNYWKAEQAKLEAETAAVSVVAVKEPVSTTPSRRLTSGGSLGSSFSKKSSPQMASASNPSDRDVEIGEVKLEVTRRVSEQGEDDSA